jgi:hypothetical protein
MDTESKDFVLTQRDRDIIALQSDVNDLKEIFIDFKRDINQNIAELKKEIRGLYKWMLGLFFGGFIAFFIGLVACSYIQESMFYEFYDVKTQIIEQEQELDSKIDSLEQELDSRFDSLEQKLMRY